MQDLLILIFLRMSEYRDETPNRKRYFELYAGLAGSLSLLNILNNSDSSVKYAKSVSSSNLAAVAYNMPALECC